MSRVNLLIGLLAIVSAVHGIAAIMALINFMWITALLTGAVAVTGVWFLDQIETAIREGKL
jgi:hypothetical protein